MRRAGRRRRRRPLRVPSKLAGDLDRIADFAEGGLLVFSGSVFTALGQSGALDPGAVVIGTRGEAAAQRVIYDAATGNLYYDADGRGWFGEQQVLVATLTNHPVLDAGDFWVA